MARTVSFLLAVLVAGAFARECTLEDSVKKGLGGSPDHVGQFPASYATAEACRDACAAESSCRQYVFNVPRKLCYRLSRVLIEEERDNDFVSGTCKPVKRGVVTRPVSCLDAKLGYVKNEANNHGSGVYTIYPGGTPYRVFCDQETEGGGWAYVMNRLWDGVWFGYGRVYTDFQKGFGVVSESNSHWLSLNAWHELTKAPSRLRIQLRRGGTKYHGTYSDFKINSPSAGYQIHMTGFTDSHTHPIGHGYFEYYHKGRTFVAPNTNWCGAYYGGWWHGWCYYTNLNTNHRWTHPWYGFYNPEHITMMVRATGTSIPQEQVTLAGDVFALARSKEIPSGKHIVSTGAYTWMFWIRMDAVHGHWASILHKGASDNMRNVGIWNYPGTTRLTVVSGIHNNWNWHFVSRRSLPLHRWTHVAFAHGDGGAYLYINGVLDTHHYLSRYPALYSSGPLYVGDPWYYAQHALMAQLSYRAEAGSNIEEDIVNAMKSFKPPVPTFQTLLSGEAAPARGKTITTPSSDSNLHSYTWMFWVKPMGTISNWGSILHRGNHNTERNIGVWLFPGSTRLHVVSGHNANWNENLNPFIPMGVWTHVAVTHSWGIVRVYINGKATLSADHVHSAKHNTGPMYLGDPWHDSANCVVRDVKFATDVATKHQFREILNKELSTFYPTAAEIREARRKAEEERIRKEKEDAERRAREIAAAKEAERRLAAKRLKEKKDAEEKAEKDRRRRLEAAIRAAKLKEEEKRRERKKKADEAKERLRKALRKIKDEAQRRAAKLAFEKAQKKRERHKRHKAERKLKVLKKLKKTKKTKAKTKNPMKKTLSKSAKKLLKKIQRKSVHKLKKKSKFVPKPKNPQQSKHGKVVEKKSLPKVQVKKTKPKKVKSPKTKKPKVVIRAKRRRGHWKRWLRSRVKKYRAARKIRRARRTRRLRKLRKQLAGYNQRIRRLRKSVRQFQKALLKARRPIVSGERTSVVGVSSNKSSKQSKARISANAVGAGATGGQVTGSGPHHIYNIFHGTKVKTNAKSGRIAVRALNRKLRSLKKRARKLYRKAQKKAKRVISAAAKRAKRKTKSNKQRKLAKKIRKQKKLLRKLRKRVAKSKRRGGKSKRRGGKSKRRGGKSKRRGGKSKRRGGKSKRRGGKSKRGKRKNPKLGRAVKRRLRYRHRKTTKKVDVDLDGAALSYGFTDAFE